MHIIGSLWTIEDEASQGFILSKFLIALGIKKSLHASLCAYKSETKYNVHDQNNVVEMAC